MLACRELLSVSLSRLVLLVNVVLVAESGACTLQGCAVWAHFGVPAGQGLQQAQIYVFKVE